MVSKTMGSRKAGQKGDRLMGNGFEQKRDWKDYWGIDTRTTRLNKRVNAAAEKSERTGQQRWAKERRRRGKKECEGGRKKTNDDATTQPQQRGLVGKTGDEDGGKGTKTTRIGGRPGQQRSCEARCLAQEPPLPHRVIARVESGGGALDRRLAARHRGTNGRQQPAAPRRCSDAPTTRAMPGWLWRRATRGRSAGGECQRVSKLTKHDKKEQSVNAVKLPTACAGCYGYTELASSCCVVVDVCAWVRACVCVY